MSDPVASENSAEDPPEWFRNWAENNKPANTSSVSTNVTSRAEDPARNNSGMRSSDELLTRLEALPEQIVNSIREAFQTPSQPAKTVEKNVEKETTEKATDKAEKAPAKPPGKKSFAEVWYG